VTDPWASVPALVDKLPQPALLQTEMKERIQQAYAALYEERGQVNMPEDTYDMQRRLARTEELFKGYTAAFAAARKLLGQLREEELVEARGEQEGIPLDGLTVPDADGDIRISLDAPAVHDIDMDQVVATYVAAMLDGTHLNHGDWPELLATVITSAIEWMHTIGKFEPQVSKVRAWGATLARNGRDQDAATVRGAITQRNPYKGVKFERKRP
jgi:hypothetical protein